MAQSGSCTDAFAKTTQYALLNILGVLNKVGKNRHILILIYRPTKKTFFSKKNCSENVKIGDVVSYKWTKMTLRGIPKQTEIYKIRKDVKWEDVLAIANNDVILKSKTTEGTITNIHKHARQKNTQQNFVLVKKGLV